jgi:ribosomal protein S18 acetylase RimI-like enzyme
MKIRKAKKSDCKKLVALFNLFVKKNIYNKPGKDSFYKVIADPKCSILIAEDKKNLVGFITFTIRHVVRYAQPVGQVEELFVLKSFRKQGIGKKLILAIEKTAKRLKCSRVYIESRQDLKIAHKFYQNLGFKKSGYYFLKEKIQI